MLHKHVSCNKNEIREWTERAIEHYGEGNYKCMNSFDPEKTSPFAMYFDFINQNWHTLSEPIPYGGF